jgi:hypothetical protein
MKDEKVEFNAENETQMYKNSADYLRDQFVHIFSNYSYRNEPFETENPSVKESSTLVTTYIFENRNAGEHMFNLKVRCNLSKHSYSLEILEAKNQKLKKILGDVNWSELSVQMNAYQTFIQNALMNDVFWRKKTMLLNTFDDVKNQLISKISNLKLILSKEPNPSNYQNQAEYYMKINDCFIGTLTLEMVPSEKEEDIQALHLSANYTLKVGFNIALSNQVSSGELTVPVITDNKNSVSQLVSQAASAIDNKQISSFKDLKKKISEYFTVIYPEIEIEEVAQDPNAVMDDTNQYVYYNMKFENSSVEMYLASQWNQGGYNQFQLMVDAPGNQFYNPSVNVTFLRSRKDDLFKLLNESGANNIFQSVFMDITSMFTYGFQEIQRPHNEQNPENQIKDLELYDNTSNLTGDKSKGLSNGDVTMSYSVKSTTNSNKKVIVEFKCTSKDLSFKKSFKLSEYDRGVVWGTMSLFLNEYKGSYRMVL